MQSAHVLVPPGLDGSWEQLLHASGYPRFYVGTASLRRAVGARAERLQWAIGVVYRPETERLRHYHLSRLADEFDVVIHVDATRAATGSRSWRGRWSLPARWVTRRAAATRGGRRSTPDVIYRNRRGSPCVLVVNQSRRGVAGVPRVPMSTYDHKPGGRSLVEHPVGALHRSGPGPGKRTLDEGMVSAGGAAAPIARKR